MGGFVKPLRKLNKKSGLGKYNPGVLVGESLSPDMPEVPEPLAPPTIDDAQRNRQDQDRLRRRKGVLANIFAGASGGTPTVGKQTLGG